MQHYAPALLDFQIPSSPSAGLCARARARARARYSRRGSAAADAPPPARAAVETRKLLAYAALAAGSSGIPTVIFLSTELPNFRPFWGVGGWEARCMRLDA
jgi:hypothetical protein